MALLLYVRDKHSGKYDGIEVEASGYVRNIIDTYGKYNAVSYQGSLLPLDVPLADSGLSNESVIELSYEIDMNKKDNYDIPERLHKNHRITFTKDGQGLIIGSTRGINLIDLVNKKIENILCSSENISSVSYCSNKDTYAYSTYKTIYCKNVMITGHQAGIISIVITNDGSKIISNSFDRTIRIWDSCTGYEIGRLEDDNGKLYHELVITDDDKYIIAHRTDSLNCWFLSTGRIVHKFSFIYQDYRLSNFSIIKDTHTIVTINTLGQVSYIDIDSGDTLRSFNMPRCNISTLRVSNDGNLLLITALNQELILWDCNTNKEKCSKQLNTEPQLLFANFNEDCSKVACVDNLGLITVYG